MKDEEVITKMLEIAQDHINRLDHNSACHFSIKLAGIIIGMSLANINKATSSRKSAKEDMQKFKEMVNDEANFYYKQQLKV